MDVTTYVDDIQSFTAELDYDAFKADRKTQLAVIRAFEVIGEASKRLPTELLETQIQVNWRAVKGFRDDQYDSIDLEIIWDAVGQLPTLRQAIQALLNSLPEDDEG